MPITEGLLNTSDLFFSGEGGYTMVRVPAIVVSPKGTLLAFCKATDDALVTASGRTEGSDTLLRRSFDGGGTWEVVQVVKKGGWHPVPLVDHMTGRILVVVGGLLNQIYVLESDDDGETWSPLASYEPDEVRKDDWLMGTPSTCHGIQLRTGRLIVPCYHQMSREAVAEGSHVRGSHVMYSDDHGKTWTVGDEIAPRTEECTVLQTFDGRVYINMRRHNRDYYEGFPGWGRRAVAWSKDGGETWSDLKVDDALVEYSCNASVVRLTDKHRHDRNRVLFSNPASTDRRERLTVRLSYDECRTWPVARLLDPGMTHYSDLAVLPDMTVACLYEASAEEAPFHDLARTQRVAGASGDIARPTSSQYHKITFARFNLEWITGGADSVIS